MRLRFLVLSSFCIAMGCASAPSQGQFTKQILSPLAVESTDWRLATLRSGIETQKASPLFSAIVGGAIGWWLGVPDESPQAGQCREGALTC